MILYSLDLYLVQITLGLAYICGVFPSHIYIADSRRDSVSMYFGKRGMTGCTYCQAMSHVFEEYPVFLAHRTLPEHMLHKAR